MTDQAVVVVTGSSRGVGRGLAEFFLSEGYVVAGCSRGQATLSGSRYDHSIIDVGDEHQVHRWISGIAKARGRIDIVINNASVGPSSLALVTSTDVAESTLRTNFLGTFSICRESAKIMIRQRFGRIINISSMAVGLHMPGASAYVASKSAVEDFTKVLAKELGPSGITCNVIALSLVDTDMMDSLKHEVVEKYMQSLVFNRKTEMKDICNAVEFFASPSSSYITGQILRLGFVD